VYLPTQQLEADHSMRFFGFIFSWRGIIALAFGVLLAACTVVVDEGPRPGPIPQPQYCTREYAPVCAVRSGDRQTFANGCRAEQAGYRIVRQGECRGDFDGGDRVACTREYRPVCARRDGRMRTFPNACEARAADFRIVGDNPC
jgi:hypothetical protein